MRRIIKRMTVVFTALYIAVIAAVTLPGFFGCRIETVISGSMEPGIPAGSVIYVRRVDFEGIEVNDVITYRLKDGNTKVTHRVTGKNAESESFITKGDANDKEDAGEVEYARVEGKVIFSVPVLGRAALLLTSLRGKGILAFFLLALCGLSGLASHSGKKNPVKIPG